MLPIGRVMLRTRWLISTARLARSNLRHHTVQVKSLASLKAPGTNNGEPKVSRFDRRLSVLRVNKSGDLAEEETTIKELLLTTDMHIRDVIALSPDNPIRSTRLSPCILPRGGVIVIVMFPLRLVISRDRVLAFDPQDPTVRLMVEELAHSLKVMQPDDEYHGSLSGEPHTFELIVLEQVLRSISQSFARIAELLGLIVETTLATLTENTSAHADQLYKLVPLKDGLAVSQQSILEVCDVLAALLGNDEDMLGLLLTERAALRGTERLDPSRHGEVELLLENYHRTLLLTGQQIAILRTRVQSAQEVFAINVDLYRNRVLRMDLLLTIMSTSLAACTTVAGFLGMNLLNGLESHPSAFKWVTGGSLVMGAALFMTATALIRGQGQLRIQEDLQSMQAYTSIFKHIRSISHALYRTSVDPSDPEMGNSKEFRKHFRNLLSSVRQSEVSWRELDLIIDLVVKSADTLRQSQRRGETATEEQVYRQLFESVSSRQEGPTLAALAQVANAALNQNGQSPGLGQASTPPTDDKATSAGAAPPNETNAPHLGATDSTGDPASSPFPPDKPPPTPKK